MNKLLTVCRSAQGKKYTSSINIKGDYLKKYGFELGDFVKVTVCENKIIIEKNSNTEYLNAIGMKDKALFEVIEHHKTDIS